MFVIEDVIGVTDGLKAKLRNGQVGEVRPHLEHHQDTVWSHDRRRIERRVMVIDRENDYYRQTWYGPDGEVSFTKEGRLSDPDMHGRSARRASHRDQDGE